jgi:hypothetical protein
LELVWVGRAPLVVVTEGNGPVGMPTKVTFDVFMVESTGRVPFAKKTDQEELCNDCMESMPVGIGAMVNDLLTQEDV